MNKIYRIFFFLSIIFSIISCDEDPTQLGEDLLPPSDDFILAADSSTASSISTILQDTVITHSDMFDYTYLGYYDTDSMNLLGDYYDNIRGNKNADLLLRFLPPYGTNKGFPANAHADSLVLYLNVDSVLKGEKSANLQYEIYDVVTPIKTLDTVYSNTDLSTYKGNKLGEGKFNFNSKSVRIAFNLDGNQLRNKLMKLDSIGMRDTIFLKETLKGFYISVRKEGSEGAIAVLNTALANYNTTRLTLYYNDSLYFHFFTRDHFNGAFSLHSNVTGSIASTENSHAFVQGLVGPNTKMEFPDVKEIWKDSGTIAINKAELVISPDVNYLSSLGIISKDYPLVLQLYYKTTASNGKTQKVALAKSFLINGAYHFNITSYYQFLLRNKLAQTPLYIKDYYSLYSSGVMAFKKGEATQLKILYSKLK
ncbi:MAG TPA: hypothetical protein VHO72_02995 [Bacteroidales bacterium]|nr:hypothetical protein [Bacteroidales bacterium]